MNLIFAIIFSLNASELLQRHCSQPLDAESTMEALLPWETPVEGFFIRSHHGVPSFDIDTWTLRIDGLVEKPLTLKFKDLKAMPSKSLHSVLECSGNGRGLQNPKVPGVQWSKGAVGNADWTGVKISDVLKLARPKPNAKFLRVEGMDHPAKPSVPPYVRSIPIEKAMEENSILAWNMNRRPLTPFHGAPLRLVLPDWYAHSWVKWVAHITLTDAEDDGYYMKKAYRMPKKKIKPGEAWDSATGVAIEELRVQSIIVSPQSGEKVKKGPVLVQGKTFSGAGAISKVEISVDEGKTWMPANVINRSSTGGWKEFNLEINLNKLGPVKILSRATDERGNTQPMETQWNPGGFLKNSADEVAIEVAEEAQPTEITLVRNKCLTCHTMEMIQIQRLTEVQWKGVIKKMQFFGADLNEKEKAVVLSYVKQFSPNKPREDDPLTNANAEELTLTEFKTPEGNPYRGASLFGHNCSSCHGKKGEGLIGPALLGRNVPYNKFWQTVLFGRGEMPAFDKQLKRQEISDIQSYLVREQ